MSWDKVWDNVFLNQTWGKYPAEDLIRFVAKNFYHMPQRKKTKILEVGCGPGANLWYMAREGFAVYGIDGSKTAISYAKHRLDMECPEWEGELQNGDILKLPYADEFFDGVIDNEAVYANSYENAKKIYSEMVRVCKTGGKFFSRTFANDSWGDKTGKKVGRNAWQVGEGPLLDKGYSRFTYETEIEDLIQGVKFVEIEMLMRTGADRTKAIKEWIIIGEKYADVVACDKRV